MSNITTPTLSPTDPRAVFAAAVTTAGEVIASVRPDQTALPTPCDDIDVAGMFGHLLMVLERVVALGTGRDPMDLPDETDAPLEQWMAEWKAAAHRVQEAWSDTDVLDRQMWLPWAQGPGGQMLGSYTAELTVHTWDLATALGRMPAWDARALETAWAAYQAMLPGGDRQARFDEVRAQMPPEYPVGPPPFLDAVDLPADAPLIERIVAWTGRQPASAA
ncbi:MAG: TIGR03086 family protein [Ilumatobacter sp.]|nr:TIGR03086 family protein [Ilumatobacter sp.]